MVTAIIALVTAIVGGVLTAHNKNKDAFGNFMIAEYNHINNVALREQGRMKFAMIAVVAIVVVLIVIIILNQIK